MDRIFRYTLREEDLADTAGGLVNLILKNRIRVTGHEISRAKFMKDGITADGRMVRVKERILPGQTLQVILRDEEEAEARLVPREGPLEILYEDQDLVAVNKPAGVVVHPSHGHFRDSLANFLAWHYQCRNERVVCRVIGRLDKDTSGILLFAKNRAAGARLFRQREEQILQRTYYAVLDGIPEKQEGDLRDRMGRVPDSILKRMVYTGELAEQGDLALLHYRICRTDPVQKISLAEIRIQTGRTHQIRVQMAHAGYPLAGDPLYNPGAGEGGRALLHAGKLVFLQPFSGEKIVLQVPFPEDFKAACTGMRELSVQDK